MSGRALRCTVATMAALATAALPIAPSAAADNRRLNDGVVANVYTVQRQAGCSGDIRIEPRLRLAAQWHANDVINNRHLAGHDGSDASTPQGRAWAAGYRGVVAETVAINPALSITGVEVINQWYRDPISLETMRNCHHREIGVWSENRLDRTVVVAVYGRPDHA